MGELAAADALGPTTEARFAAAFSTRAVVDKKAAADLIGVDVKTLDTLPIRSVPKGAYRGYTERDLRRYLIEGPDAECEPTPPRPKARSTPNVRVVNFSERRGKR